MSELGEKYQRALHIIARRCYIITPEHLVIEEYKNGVFTVCEKYKEHRNCTYNLSLSEIEIVYEAMCDMRYGSIHSRDHWGMILEKARKMEKERETT